MNVWQETKPRLEGTPSADPRLSGGSSGPSAGFGPETLILLPASGLRPWALLSPSPGPPFLIYTMGIIKVSAYHFLGPVAVCFLVHKLTQ